MYNFLFIWFLNEKVAFRLLVTFFLLNLVLHDRQLTEGGQRRKEGTEKMKLEQGLGEKDKEMDICIVTKA